MQGDLLDEGQKAVFAMEISCQILVSFLQAPLWWDCVACATGHTHPPKILGEPVIFIGHRVLRSYEVIPFPVFFINLLDSYRDFILAFKSVGIV
jgi:hypothetical protein